MDSIDLIVGFIVSIGTMRFLPKNTEVIENLTLLTDIY